MRAFLVVVVLSSLTLLTGCNLAFPPCVNVIVDADGDGVDGEVLLFEASKEQPWVCIQVGSEPGPDCNDSNPSTFPGATEFCDKIDNDCDGAIDNDCFEPRRDTGGDTGGDSGS